MWMNAMCTILYKYIKIVGAAIIWVYFMLHVICKTYPSVDMLNREKNQNGKVLIVQSINKLES